MKTRNLIYFIATILILAIALPGYPQMTRKEYRKEKQELKAKLNSPKMIADADGLKKENKKKKNYLANHDTSAYNFHRSWADYPWYSRVVEIRMSTPEGKIYTEECILLHEGERDYLALMSDVIFRNYIEEDKQDSVIYKKLYELVPWYNSKGQRITGMLITNVILKYNPGKKEYSHADYLYSLFGVAWGDSTGYFCIPPDEKVEVDKNALRTSFMRLQGRNTNVEIDSINRISKTAMYRVNSDTIYIPLLVGENIGGRRGGGVAIPKAKGSPVQEDSQKSILHENAVGGAQSEVNPSTDPNNNSNISSGSSQTGSLVVPNSVNSSSQVGTVQYTVQSSDTNWSVIARKFVGLYPNEVDKNGNPNIDGGKNGPGIASEISRLNGNFPKPPEPGNKIWVK